MINTLKHQYLAIAWAVFTLIICDMHMDGGIRQVRFFEGFDKLVHTGVFFTFSVLLFYGKITQQKSYSYRIVTILKIFALSTILGGSIELLQWKVFTWRSADWWDLFCDILGTCMAIFSYIFLHRVRFNGKVV
ncbi:VanZ family protein [Hufsiella ginkgonis]|uniref:Glycine cleavage system protein H n=1 Tax=Hufsiella ginkgonis TaxID=2695274 RepID=A0A7K1Y112_9SPHI|nr:VanZ family protein [Hufsiella ginkgonis]MXV16954.1 hypothetical protein [Hufsiella ginkgonis]